MKRSLKNEKGVNLISLTVSVIIILILTGIILYNVKDNLGVQNLKNMQTDIGNLREKVSVYYAQYGEIPADTSDDTKMEYTKISHLKDAGIISEQVDTGKFYVIDLSAMENVTLTYGEDYEKIRNGEVDTNEVINTLDDLYIINATSHNIFYVKGITLDGEKFYTDYIEDDADIVGVEIFQDSEVDEIWSPEYDVTATYKDENGDVAYIPKDFKVSRKIGENTISDGLVISDMNNNEFVWVPVRKEKFSAEFIRHDYGIQGIANSDFINTVLTDKKYYETTADGLSVDTTASTSTQEVQKMYKSVKEYGGFYIGRYEAGNDGSDNVICQKDSDVYNNIGWSYSDDMTDETGGAVEKARGFSVANNYTSATSTLVYGVQWDSIMRWINEDAKLHGYLKDSIGKGNYQENTGNPIKTGTVDEYEMKNIYDMAGNVSEWTMESYSTMYRVCRGGCYDNDGSQFPITYRDTNSTATTLSETLGFRIALYIE